MMDSGVVDPLSKPLERKQMSCRLCVRTYHTNSVGYEKEKVEGVSKPIRCHSSPFPAGWGDCSV